jgi:hypothetical protein
MYPSNGLKARHQITEPLPSSAAPRVVKPSKNQTSNEAGKRGVKDSNGQISEGTVGMITRVNRSNELQEWDAVFWPDQVGCAHKR